MKPNLVAIISYNIHSNHMNYGAALHSYAFQQYLRRKGINSIIIDYIPKDINITYLKYPILNIKYFWHFSYFIRWGLGFFSNLRKYKKFNSFFLNHTFKTEKRYSHEELIKTNKLECECDTFVCESDVIWKLYEINGFNDVFFLNIPVSKGKKKVAYSPSLGSRQFTNEETEKFKLLVSDFSAISTRERQGALYLTKILNKKVDWVLDPTLLFDKSFYSNISIKPNYTNYLLVYNCMINDQDMVKQAEKFASSLNLKVIEISNFFENKIRYNHIVKTDIGIEEWLGFFENASYIICNAFHGFCFSVIYEKPVLLFQRDASDYRMKNITDSLGLNDRFIPYNNKIIPSSLKDIDYKIVNKELELLKKHSEQFIEDHIVNL